MLNDGIARAARVVFGRTRGGRTAEEQELFDTRAALLIHGAQHRVRRMDVYRKRDQKSGDDDWLAVDWRMRYIMCRLHFAARHRQVWRPLED